MPLKTERECASSCSVTPSYNSNRDDDGSDSDYESDHGEDRYDHLYVVLSWWCFAVYFINDEKRVPLLFMFIILILNGKNLLLDGLFFSCGVAIAQIMYARK